MKLEILTNFTHNGAPFYIGELRVVDDATGDYFLRAGWAKDPAGILVTGTPSSNEVVLEVANLNQQSNTEVFTNG